MCGKLDPAIFRYRHDSHHWFVTCGLTFTDGPLLVASGRDWRRAPVFGQSCSAKQRSWDGRSVSHCHCLTFAASSDFSIASSRSAIVPSAHPASRGCLAKQASQDSRWRPPQCLLCLLTRYVEVKHLSYALISHLKFVPEVAQPFSQVRVVDCFHPRS